MRFETREICGNNPPKNENPTPFNSETSVSSRFETPKLFIPFESKQKASASRASPTRKTPTPSQHSFCVPFLNLPKPTPTPFELCKTVVQISHSCSNNPSAFTLVQPVFIKNKPLSEEQKLLKLVRSEDCHQFFKNTAKELKMPIKSLQLKRKILKSGLTTKISSFWAKRSLQCPLIFKRIGVEEDDTQAVLVEVRDLIKVQGGCEWARDSFE